MAITSLTRDWGIVPSIVRMVSTDSLSAVGTPGYLTAQNSNIVSINEGAFSWLPSDVVLVDASDGWSFFSISSDFTSLNPLNSGLQSVSVNLTAAQILGMYAAPVLILPAPAANTVNVVSSAVWNIKYGAAQFAAGGVIALQYANTVHGAGTAASSTIAAATLNGVAANTILTMTAPASIALANATAQGLYLSNQTAAFTTGDSTATLKVYYRNVYVL